ncbi:PTS lactose/cellobiose transporter subunit IIA [Faecalicatena orotica]|uniref:PTS system cellobiose-specific IIA component n=1 Tax=Faecalicatena orotica TaxID=1544 RepID=A0A2Y9BGU6_9FIRM|nr:PTS lactose/cellobiose transporter subunit IIA [Faecalicatena orotica]PWJ28906.1 PTS system cellobiose-specific IIA component [Faecalicatena orotica]SSA56075.1 PTS system, cellobiose-specific IIA component [Faecalicatena orotica]
MEKQNSLETGLETFEDNVMALITNGGSAKSEYVKAIQYSREGKFEKANEIYENATKMYDQAHSVHFSMIGMENMVPRNQMESLLLIHAEDQLNSAETFKILYEEFKELYKMIRN